MRVRAAAQTTQRTPFAAGFAGGAFWLPPVGSPGGEAGSRAGSSCLVFASLSRGADSEVKRVWFVPDTCVLPLDIDAGGGSGCCNTNRFVLPLGDGGEAGFGLLRAGVRAVPPDDDAWGCCEGDAFVLPLTDGGEVGRGGLLLDGSVLPLADDGRVGTSSVSGRRTVAPVGVANDSVPLGDGVLNDSVPGGYVEFGACGCVAPAAPGWMRDSAPCLPTTGGRVALGTVTSRGGGRPFEPPALNVTGAPIEAGAKASSARVDTAESVGLTSRPRSRKSAMRPARSQSSQWEVSIMIYKDTKPALKIL
jgi:hypothetical protein